MRARMSSVGPRPFPQGPQTTPSAALRVVWLGDGWTLLSYQFHAPSGQIIISAGDQNHWGTWPKMHVP